MLIFGVGSGRCGTTSLRLFLDLQRDVSVTHELNFDGNRQPMPWQPDHSLARQQLQQLQQKSAVIKGDIGFYWLPYTEWILAQYDDARFICLKRNKADTVVSYLHRTKGRNHWLQHSGTRWELDEIWDKAFPKYDIEDKQEAVSQYWEDYYAVAERLQREHARNFCIFPVDALNSYEGQSAILSFVGIFPADMIFTPSFRLNTCDEG
jgi:hypothetical protein